MPESALSSNKEVVKKEGKNPKRESEKGTAAWEKVKLLSFTDCLIAAPS